ncbi:MAG TPA: menaquinone biosynthesis protein [Terriglobales bacterium]|nr:menaquinone biosynthesis protein [Terriglobales bacterium]
MCALRISAISYLNTAPLMWDFQHGSASSDFEISYTIPSACADALARGTADIGIIPSIVFATVPDLLIIPDAAIASKRAVRSILLLCREPLERVSTVAADISSRTSVVLTQVLMRKFFPAQSHGRSREFIPMPPNPELMLRRCDAALLIGDPALQADREQYLTYDLAEQWVQFTGKPFVFAFWAIRMAALSQAHPKLEMDAVFSRSRDHGLEPANVSLLAREWAPRLGLPQEEITSYLTHNIHYYLDRENVEGLNLFYRYAAECGLIAAPPTIRFIGSAAFRMYG